MLSSTFRKCLQGKCHVDFGTTEYSQHGAVTRDWNVSLYIIQDTPPFCPYMVTCRFSVVFIPVTGRAQLIRTRLIRSST